jgi:hypothetical protein
VRVATSGTVCIALEDFEGGANKIAFKKGEPIEIVERVSAEWWHGVNAAGVEGRFPSELVDATSAIPPPIESDTGKGALELDVQVYAGRSKWEGSVNLRSFETTRDAMALALRAASVSDDRIDKVSVKSDRFDSLTAVRCVALCSAQCTVRHTKASCKPTCRCRSLNSTRT